MKWKLRVRCTTCEFTDIVEQGFVNCLADGIKETRCNKCDQTTLRFEVNMGSEDWHHLQT